MGIVDYEDFIQTDALLRAGENVAAGRMK